MVDFGNGMTFRVYTSTTEATEVLQRNGANVINYNAQNRYYVATANAGGSPTGSRIVRLRVQNGTLTYFDGDNGTTVHGSVLAEETGDPALKGVIVNHANLMDAGKIKIYPQQNGAPLILNSVEIVNLDEDGTIGVSKDHEPYTVFDTDALVLNLAEEQAEVEAVKFGGQFLSESEFAKEGETLEISAAVVDGLFEETRETVYECVVYTPQGRSVYEITLTVPPDVKITYVANDGQTVLHEDTVGFYETVVPYDNPAEDFYAWYDENGKKVDFTGLQATANVTYYAGMTTDSHAVEFFYRNNLGEEKSVTLEIPCGTTLKDAIEILDEESDYNAAYGSMGYELLQWNFAEDYVIDQAETVTATYAELVNSQDLFVDFENGTFFDPLDWYLTNLTAKKNGGEIVWQFSGYMDNVSTQQTYKDFEFSFDIGKLTDVFCEEYLFSVEFAIPEDMRSGLVGSRGIAVHFIISDQTGSLYAYVISHDVLLSTATVIPEFADLSTAEERDHSYPAGGGETITSKFKFVSVLQDDRIRIHVRYENGNILLGYSEDGGEPVWSDAIALPEEYANQEGLVSLGRNDPRLNDGTIAFDNIRLENISARESELIVIAKDKTANEDGTFNYVVGQDEIPALNVSFRGQSLLGIKYAVGIDGVYSDLQSADIILEEMTEITDTVSLNISFIAGLIAANQAAFDVGTMSLKFRIVTQTDWKEIVFKLSGVPFSISVYNDGAVLETFNDLSCGEQITLPAAPEKEGYDFVGYKNRLTGEIETERNISAVLKADYELVYEIKTFTVRFFDKEGKLLQTVRNVEYGSSLPEAPLKEDGTSYTWTGTYDNVTSDLEIYEEGYGDSGCGGELGGAGFALAVISLSAALALVCMRKRRAK